MKLISFNKRMYQLFKVFYKLTGQCRKMDDHFLVERFVDSLQRLHFTQQGASAAERRDFFRKHLVEIEVETHGYCNRTCSFCPNAHFSRADKSQIMPEDVFDRIIAQLKSIDYAHTLKLHRYNEPLALDIIFDRIRRARRELPRARIGFHSNGDYVTAEKLKELESAGLDFVIIGMYLDAAGSREALLAEAKDRCREFLRRRDLEAHEVPADGALVRYRVRMEKLQVAMFVPDVASQWNDRGGTLKSYARHARVSPCESPFGRLLVDWTGDVLPCCNLRGDVAAHKPYILGNAATTALEDIYFSGVANGLRRKLAGFDIKEGACRTCHYASFPQDDGYKALVEKKIRKLDIDQ